MIRVLLFLIGLIATSLNAQLRSDDVISDEFNESPRPRARLDTGKNFGSEQTPAPVALATTGSLAARRPRARPHPQIGTALAIEAGSGAANLRRAMSLVRDEDWRQAIHAAGSAGTINHDIVLWSVLREGQGHAGDVIRFLARNGDWPGLPYLRKQSEDTLATASVEDRLTFFDESPAQTGIGALAQASALEAVGKSQAAQDTISMAWRTLALSTEEQEAFLARYGEFLRPYHQARLDHLLWQGWTINANRMLPLVSDGWRRLGEARIALRNRAGNPDPLIARVPKALGNHPGLAYERFEWRMRKGLRAQATTLLLDRSRSADGLGEAAYWAKRRHDMAHRAMRDGDPKLAYRIAASHFLETGSTFRELEWLSGYLALRFLNDNKRAVSHFTRFQNDVVTPISVGRAGYWLGRAHEAAGNAEAAQDAYAMGARYQTSFYGLLAAERGGLSFGSKLAAPLPDGDWRQAEFTRSSVHQAALMLLAAGEDWLAERFWTHLAESQPTAQLQMMGKMLNDLGQPHIAVMLGKRAAQAGLEIAAPYYALHPVAARRHPVPTEMVLAIARRESEFDHTVISHAGARGLMQVMPATAKIVARRIGLPYSRNRLTQDWVYNSKLGADYLRGLAEEFDGNVIMMAAGYNAGPGRPRSWMGRYGNPLRGEIDMIDWIESIPFDETRNYVMRVAESLPVYRARLGKPPHPVSFSNELTGATLRALAR